MPSIYIPEVVQIIQQNYGALLFEYDWPIKNRFEKMADKLWEAFQDKKEFACKEINNYHPDYLSKSPAFLFEVNLTLEDIRTTIACEHSFKSWEEVEVLSEQQLDQEFEKAVDTLLAGDIEGLKNQLDRNPTLLSQTSSYPHHATLLHYAGSNGVEFYRQQVPLNLPEITRFLLAAGADKTAKMNVYGGQFDTLAMLTTSAHPYKAGIAEEMKAILATE